MMKIKHKLLIQALLLAVVPAIIVATVSTWQANKSAFSALEKKANEQLISLREVKKTQINDYLNLIQGQVVTLANNPAIKDAASLFTKTFNTSYSLDIASSQQKEKLSS